MLKNLIPRIIEDAIEYKKKRGIYFLIKGWEVVYIWKTTNFDERIQTHLKEKDFEKYFFHEITDPYLNLDILENDLIIENKPKLNKLINKPDWYLSKKELWNKYRVWKKFIIQNTSDIHKFEYWSMQYFCENHVLLLLKK